MKITIVKLILNNYSFYLLKDRLQELNTKVQGWMHRRSEKEPAQAKKNGRG